MNASFDVFRDAAARLPMGTFEIPSRVRERSVALPADLGLFLDEDERAQCAVAECTAQARFWKRSARPVFEGQWSCCAECRELLIRDAIRRCMPAAMECDGSREHRHRIPLGLVLLDRGLVTQAQLREALAAQKDAGHGRIGYWLQKGCGLAETTVARGLAAQWGRPLLSGNGLVPSIMANVMPAGLRAKFDALPLRVAGGHRLYVAFRDGISPTVVRMLERMSGLRVEAGLMSDGEFAAASEELNSRQSMTVHEHSVSTRAELEQKISQALQKEQPVASRLTAAHGSWWLRLWLERGAVGAHGCVPATGEDVVDYVFHMDAGLTDSLRES